MKKLLTLMLITLTLTATLAQGQWSELGGFNSLAANAVINSLCTDKFNNVYAAGAFTNASGKQYVAKFDGATWSELGGLNALNANNQIFSITSDSLGHIYAAGRFTNASGSKYVAKWDGIAWSEVGSVITFFAGGDIKALHIDKYQNLYAGGHFINANNNRYVAKWDGATWTELGGLNSLAASDQILTIESDTSGNIFAAGWFQNNFSKQYVAKFNGTIWSEVGLGIDTLNADAGITSVTCDYSGNIYCSGVFNNDSGYRYVAVWNGFSWSELGGNNYFATIYPIPYVGFLHKSPSSIYATGGMLNSSGFTYIPDYSNNMWNELGGLNSLYNFAGLTNITRLTYDKLNNIYISGGGLVHGNLGYVAKYTSPNSITEHNKNFNFSASPNPATEYLELNISPQINGHVTIANLLGETVLLQNLNKRSTIKFNISNLPAGIFLLKVSDNKTSVTKKFIKSN